MKNYEKATFAGGCFWCMEPPFENLDGVIEVVAGYSGGDVENPTYEQVSTGETGHFEAVQITYSHEKITYKKLLKIFWKNIDPTDAQGQFADKGPQYKTAIFYHNEKQRQSAEKSKKELEKKQIFKGKIKTQILPYKNF
jgi:peptide methionine sulfoxide reductase msrA/msrB